MKVIGKGEYGEVISRYFQRSFPKRTTISKPDLLEILTDLLVGTKEHRYGPKPKIESLYTIRQTLSKAIELDAPIPVLVPWGGRKMDPSLSIDVAEVSGLKQLIALDEVIRQFFTPGLHIHIRIEDINAKWLYKSDKGVDKYSSDMIKLINLLKGTTHIEGIRESSMMEENEYMRLAENYGYLLDDVIIALETMPSLDINTIPSYQKLVERGWKGDIPENQRHYYLDRYKSLYPNASLQQRINKLSDYFAGSKVRYDLSGRGEPDSIVGSFLQINFAHPVPGAPTSMFNNTLYYRTVPESSGRTHIAPWRAKGYLELVDDIPVAKVTQSSSDISELQENEVYLVEDESDNPLIIRADYHLPVLSYLSYPPHAMAM